jgi:hypothetical protein
MSKPSNTLTTFVEQAKALDNIVSSALTALGAEGSFENAFAVADAMNELKSSITPPMMERFMALQNTALGFRTDCDPKGRTPKAPYSAEVVKDAVIEATLRGVQPVGNMFNILAGRCYITKEGFEYKLKKLEGLSGFKPIIGIAKLVGDKGAIVPCAATWQFKGRTDSLSIEIPVRVNEGMGMDAIQGKASRKFLKRVFEQITGTSIPDGEVGDEALVPTGPKSPAALPQFYPSGQAGTKPAKVPDPVVMETINQVPVMRRMLVESGISEEVLLQYLWDNDYTLEKHGKLEDLSAPALENVVNTWAIVEGEIKRLPKQA